MRWILIALAVLVALSVVWVLLHPSHAGDRSKLDRTFTAAEQQTIASVTITQQQLSKATCQDGAKCWIAVNGVVYDMGVFPQWLTGLHHGVHAGADDTEQFVKAGHGKEVLQRMPVVGKYAG